jgi:hypothetical protein
MKINRKALELVETGLSTSSVMKLSESQIKELHSRIFNEQTGVRNEKKTVDVTTVSQQALQQGVSVGGRNMKKDSSGNLVVTNEEMSEEDGKDSKNNPYAICRKQLGPRKNAKFESCVKQVKKSLKEGKNPISLFIENKIMEIVETNLPPKITKKDLVKYLSEAEPATAPVKEPKTKPGTKPPPSPVKTPLRPGKNPYPGTREAPMAKKKSKEVSENSPTIAPSGPKTKPETKPGTKPPPSPVKTPLRPGKNPYPGTREAPMAKSINPEEAKEKIIDTIMKMLKK